MLKIVFSDIFWRENIVSKEIHIIIYYHHQTMSLESQQLQKLTTLSNQTLITKDSIGTCMKLKWSNLEKKKDILGIENDWLERTKLIFACSDERVASFDGSIFLL